VRRVTLLCSSSGEHLGQLYAGFALIEATGRIEVELRTTDRFDPGGGGTILQAEIDGHRVVYDTRDISTIDSELLAWSTTYFKRGFDPTVVAASKRPGAIRPLGLNYGVYSDGDWRYRRMAWSLLRLRPNNARAVATRVARLSAFGSRFTDTGRSSASVDAFEEDPAHAGRGVLLLTRTWDPQRVQGERADMRREMNRTRVEGIRLLRKELGPRFVGGLSPSTDSVRDYPDLVADPAVVKKPAYLRAMRASAVCVTSRGLVDSNGWRLAEYVAAARAIVTEPLAHTVPGEFTAGCNYLEYSDPQSLLEAVHQLLGDDEKRAAMRAANHGYYLDHVRPDAIVSRTLESLE